MRTLDKSRDYGTICGGGKAQYEQDGIMFDARGNEINPPAPVKEPEKPAEVHHEEPVKSSDEIVTEMLKEGKTRRQIKKETGIHHKTIERIAKNAQTEDDRGLGQVGLQQTES